MFIRGASGGPSRRGGIGAGRGLWAARAAAAEPAAPTVAARGYPVPPAMGQTMFSGLAPAADGYVYMGACNHKGPAHLVRLDPRTGKVADLGNMQDVTGEHDPELIEAAAFALGPAPSEGAAHLLRNPRFERAGTYLPTRTPVGWRFIATHPVREKDLDGVIGTTFLGDKGAPRTGRF